MYKNHSKKTSNQLFAILVALCFTSVCLYILYSGTAFYLTQSYEYDTKMITQYPAFTECIIVAKHSYKGKGISVEYWVNNTKYNQRTGITTEVYNKTIVGQKFKINYCSKDPSIAIVDYNSPIN